MAEFKIELPKEVPPDSREEFWVTSSPLSPSLLLIRRREGE